MAVSLATIADVRNVTERLAGVFEGKLLGQTYVIDETIENAGEVKGVSYPVFVSGFTSGPGQEWC
jgi:hypothetical protein